LSGDTKLAAATTAPVIQTPAPPAKAGADRRSCRRAEFVPCGRLRFAGEPSSECWIFVDRRDANRAGPRSASRRACGSFVEQQWLPSRTPEAANWLGRRV